MPFYNYHCPLCGDIKLQRKISEVEFKICPRCDSKLERIYQANVNLMFDGSYNNANKK